VTDEGDYKVKTTQPSGFLEKHGDKVKSRFDLKEGKIPLKNGSRLLDRIKTETYGHGIMTKAKMEGKQMVRLISPKKNIKNQKSAEFMMPAKQKTKIKINSNRGARKAV